ncbi:MAG: HD domain-containing protein [Nitrospirae bacterium]|nr:HD domain-containing protein [Nitrospirota bacterium]
MDAIGKFLTTFTITIANCSLYSAEHEIFNELVKKTYRMLGEILGEQCEIMIIDHKLIVNKQELTDAGANKANFIRYLRRKGITRVDFLKGLSLSEFRQFIIDVSDTDKIMNPAPHIRTGTIDVCVPNPRSTPCEGEEISNLPKEDIAKVQDIFHSISPFKKLNIAGLEEIVVQFIITFRNEAHILKLLSPVRSFSEYTYTHASNVAVLSIFQADSLGIQDELLHEIGVAALLHDAGKLFIPKEILDKNGKLDDREFAEIKKHPLYGARYLAKMDNLTRLAPLIAFEHHMRCDGSGYPGLHTAGRRQHILSQIIAISDFFDALRSHRPYRESLETEEVIALMRKGREKDFNPFLLDNFIRSIQMALSQEAA